MKTTASPKPAAHSDGASSSKPLLSLDSGVFNDVPVTLQAQLGQATLSIQDMLALRAGSVVKLDLKLNDRIELHLNSSLVARGEIVAVGDNFGVRITEIAERK